jgi:hypothetical protein
MAYTFTFASLITVATAAKLLERGLSVARLLSLPVDSWRAGDPTRSLYHFLAEYLSTHDQVAAEYIKAGFLDWAAGDWLKVLAYQVYGVEAEDASSASNTLRLSNSSGGLYAFDAGDVIWRSSFTGKTYHNRDPFTLNPLQSNLEIYWVADEPGADSSVGNNEIDEFVTPFPGISIVSSSAGYGSDAQSDDSIKLACRESLGATSPNGPREAYEYIAKRSQLTGTNEVTRARASGDTGNGTVYVRVASAAGPVSADALEKVERAVVVWATHIGGTPIVQNVTTTSVAYDVRLIARTSLNENTANVRLAVTQALQKLHADTRIAKAGDYLAEAIMKATIRDVYRDHTYDVILVSPSGDVPLPDGSVPVLAGTPNVVVEYRT